MKILFVGDVVGRSGRGVLCDFVPQLRAEYGLDVVIVNGENAAGGFGITPSICKNFFDHGVDVITLGNHSFDQPTLGPWIGQENRVLRPMNEQQNPVGHGFYTYKLPDGRQFAVANMMGGLFMPKAHDPFQMIDGVFPRCALRCHGGPMSAFVLDFHGEASSEKIAMGWYLDGRASLVIGSHTHVPTADDRILPKGTAFQTDAGMCGDYASIIGVDTTAALNRFLKKDKMHLDPSMGPATLCGTIVETDDRTGLALTIQTIQRGQAFVKERPSHP